LIAIGYARSQKSVSYFISTCGSTNPASYSYEAHFEDEFGVIQAKYIARLHLLEWVYDYLPLIDELNKQRQSLLHLEKKWPTKKCWFQLLVTLLGMCVVNMFRAYLNHDKDKFKNTTITEFSDMLCQNIRMREGRRPDHIASVAANHSAEIDEEEFGLERITNDDGRTMLPNPTALQREKEDRRTGKSITANCFICRKYIPRRGGHNYKTTSFCCKLCKMPLCLTDRSNGKGDSCLMEHRNSSDPDIGCTSECKKNKVFPKEKQVIMRT
jgi:hypothetical protein